MRLRTFVRWLSPAGLDLAEELLAFDPLHRVTAVQALEAPYFKVEPIHNCVAYTSIVPTLICILCC